MLVRGECPGSFEELEVGEGQETEAQHIGKVARKTCGYRVHIRMATNSRQGESVGAHEEDGSRGTGQGFSTHFRHNAAARAFEERLRVYDDRLQKEGREGSRIWRPCGKETSP